MRPYGQRGNVALGSGRIGPDGIRRCRWCDEQIPPGTRRRTWCSKKCVDEWRERGDWNHIRSRIIDRDKVCQMCGGRRYSIDFQIKADPRYPSILPQTKLTFGSWEVDHIVAVEDGGTDDPANLRLLCRRCHKDRTAVQRREKAMSRRRQLGLELPANQEGGD